MLQENPYIRDEAKDTLREGTPSLLFLINCYDLWSATPLDARDCDCVFPPTPSADALDVEPDPEA